MVIACGNQNTEEVFGIGEQYAYIRVSSRDQNEDRQLIAIQGFCIPKRNIYIDKYKKLARCMKKDDLLYIKSTDRLGRNYKEILEQWRI